MLHIYQWVMKGSEGFLNKLLQKRVRAGKEDASRIAERHGVSTKARPKGRLVWVHAASVGEAQSALILIDSLLKLDPKLNILVTTVTLTSAKRMEESLPKQAFHQFAPFDHPEWCRNFLKRWAPDGVLWMESELWPNMLLQIQERKIPAALINARLSDRSFKRWSMFKHSAKQILSVFDIIVTQSERDQHRFEALGARYVVTSGNIKYCADPLPFDEDVLTRLSAHLSNRQICVYASTHDGEEEMIMRVHEILQPSHPDLISIIIPRHPERGEAIQQLAESMRLSSMRRSKSDALPDIGTPIYIADTLGELGLFYRLAEIVYIGRSMSNDGGGGHNPIEAAQLNCAILHGARVQNLRDIYDALSAHDGSITVHNENELTDTLRMLLDSPQKVSELAARALDFSKAQSHVIDNVLDALSPLTDSLDMTQGGQQGRS